MKTNFTVFFLLIIYSVALINGYSYLNKKMGLKDDNVVEECIEIIIKKQTGLDIDLTPSSKESEEDDIPFFSEIDRIFNYHDESAGRIHLGPQYKCYHQ